MNRVLASAAARPELTLYPRKLPDPWPDLPLQYSTESDAAYAQRYYRWRVWLDYDLNRELLGGPMQSYASENEVKAYRQWRDYLLAEHVPTLRGER